MRWFLHNNSGSNEWIQNEIVKNRIGKNIKCKEIEVIRTWAIFIAVETWDT